MAELAARHVAIERLEIEVEPRGHALDDRDQAGPVGLTRCREAKRHGQLP
jgi:hypothetical protein